MTHHTIDTDLHNTDLQRPARLTGLLYLVIIANGIFAEMVVRQSLIVPGDAAATAANITAAEGLFRLGIAADLVMIVSDVAVGLLFYVLLRPISNALALLAAFFRLAQATVLGLNLLNLFFVLELLSDATYLSALGSEQLYAQALFFLEAHATGYAVGLVFFGFSILTLSYLIVRSGYLPRILGILLGFAAVVYLVDSFASFLLPSYETYADAFLVAVFVPALIAELALALWLLVRGVKAQPRGSNAPAFTSRPERAAV